MTMISVVKTIYSPDGDLGIEIVLRDNGIFGYREIKLYDIPGFGMQWRPRAGGDMSKSYFATAEIAEREARAAVDWMIEGKYADQHRHRKTMAEIAAAILSKEISPILGARRINGTAAMLDGSMRDDDDVIPFIGVDSETDTLPLDPEVRKLWAPSALDRLDPEIARSERWAYEVLVPHCKRLIERFGR